MYGFTRRDSENRLRPGITTYLTLSFGVFIVFFYVLTRFHSLPEPKQRKGELNAIPTNIGTINVPLNTWQKSDFSETGENVIVRDKKSRDVLSSRASIFSPIKGATFKGGASEIPGKLNLHELKQLMGDNGGTYVKSDFGVYALNVPAGTELKGKNKSFVVGDDLKLMQIYDGGKRKPLLEAPSYKLKDKEGRFYVVTDSLQLRLHTPGGNGRFVGPDNSAYNVLESGDIESVKDHTLVSSISGDGEFVGTDDRRYIVIQGLLFSPSTESVSFSGGVLKGKGYFTGPDGMTYVLGEDGRIYRNAADRSLVPANIEGSGTFTGPDGATYIKESNGDIRRLLGAGANGSAQKTALPEGMFIGPGGKVYFADSNGNIYSVDESGNISPASLPDEGSFISPDGKRYRIVDGKIVPDKSQANIEISAKGKILTAPDGKRYYVDKDGKTFLVGKDGTLIPAKLPEGVLHDDDGNAYIADKDGNLAFDSAVLPMGTYTDEAGNKYYADKNGRFFRVMKDGSLVPANPPAGLLKSADSNLYSVGKDGKIKRLKAANAMSAILPKGYFYGSDGGLKYSDGNGKLFEVGADGSLIEITSLPQGTFIGPDGRKYSVDGNGTIRALNETQYPALDKTDDIRPAFVRKEAVSKPGRTSAKVDVSSNLQNYNTGDENFNPAKEAGKLKGGKVYTMVVPETKPAKPVLKPEAEDNGKFMPVGTRIPFYTLTHISTNFDSGSLIEAVVAENVFFHRLAIPAGTRMYGSVGEVGSNNRIKLNFNFLLYPNGKSVPISADAYDVNMQFGLECYYTSTPPWVYALRFLNVASIYELTKNQGHSSNGEPIGNIDEVVSYLNDTIKEIEHKQEAYYTLPAGTPGILMLTSNLNLSTISDDGSSSPTTKADALLTDKERLERIKINVAMKYQEQLLEQANRGEILQEGMDFSPIDDAENGSDVKVPVQPTLKELFNAQALERN